MIRFYAPRARLSFLRHVEQSYRVPLIFFEAISGTRAAILYIVDAAIKAARLIWPLRDVDLKGLPFATTIVRLVRLE